MRQFIIFNLKIIGLFFLLLSILSITFTFIYTNSHPRNKVQAIYYLKNKQFDFAFFGSSRTENHIDCETIQKITGKSCINLGMAGASIGDIYYLMKLSRLNNLNFNEVYLQIDYNYNQDNLETTQYFDGIVAPYKNKIIDDGISIYNISKRKDWIPFYHFMLNDKVIGFREMLFGVLNKNPGFDPENGFLPQHGIGMKVYGDLPRKIRDNNKAIEQMRKIFTDVSPLKFFTAPYCHLTKNRETLASLEFRRIKVFNFTEIFDEQPEYFSNCGHLNEKGAKEFSKLFAQSVLK